MVAERAGRSMGEQDNSVGIQTADQAPNKPVRHEDEGAFGRIGHFFRDVRTEMTRVTWPTATEVRNTTIITVIAVAFFALYLFLVDHLIVDVIGRFGYWLLAKIGLA